MVTTPKQSFSLEERKMRAFIRTVEVMKGLWEEKGSSDTRLLKEPLILDSYITAGESLKGRGHREHVVPRVYLCHRCHEMFAAGTPIEEIATLLQKYLKVVHITNDEQLFLDRVQHMGLRERMPDGWRFGEDDPYARLRAAGIEFRLYES